MPLSLSVCHKCLSFAEILLQDDNIKFISAEEDEKQDKFKHSFLT